MTKERKVVKTVVPKTFDIEKSPSVKGIRECNLALRQIDRDEEIKLTYRDSDNYLRYISIPPGLVLQLIGRVKAWHARVLTTEIIKEEEV